MEDKSLIDIDVTIAYAQLAVHTLQNSGTKITPKELRQEIKMLNKKFNTEEIKKMANVIVKGNKK